MGGKLSLKSWYILILIMAVSIPNSHAPIFIVGPPRSGTSLLSAIIGSHSRIACGPETDLFSAIPVARAKQIALEPNWHEKAIEQLERVKYPDGKSLSHHFGVTVDQLRSHLSKEKCSVQSIYSAIPASFAWLQSKARWAEKTPRHLFYVEQIRELFPDAKIIRIVRDPRDSIPSVVKNIGLSDSLIGEFYRWASVYAKSDPFFREDKGGITVRYEDLVQNPEKEVTAICEFIGEAFEPRMLNRAGADHVRVATETWKRDIDKEITADNIYGWRSKLDPDIAKTASLICSEALEALEYPDPVKPVKELNVFPLGENFGVANESHIIACATRGFRYRAIAQPYPVSIDEALELYPDVLLGDLPLGKNRSRRIQRSIQAIGKILLRFLRGKPVNVDPNIQLGVGALNRLIGKVALVFGNRRTFAK